MLKEMKIKMRKMMMPTNIIAAIKERYSIE
jgi:hypothetical protein